MTSATKELAQIVQRNYSWLVSMAGLDAGVTDYALRHDLLRMIALSNVVNPEEWVGPRPVVDPPFPVDERDQT
jgi:hypothetical protein